MKKKFATVLFALLCCIISASAAGYRDVAEDSPWREGIGYVTEQGIACGTGNGCFAPDAPITTRQWATMVYHALQVKGAQSAPVQDVVRQGYEQHWLGMTALTEPDLPMCRGVLYQSAFRAFRIPIYSAELYPGGSVLSETENCVRVGKEFGLCSEEATAFQIVTRGETAELLRCLMTEQFVMTPPPLLSEFPIAVEEAVDVNDFLVELNRVPKSIRDAFREQNWSCRVQFDYLEELSREFHMSCGGATNYGTKTVYLEQAQSAVHELGHFLDYTLNFPAKHERLFQTENAGAAKVLGSYSQRNSHEYFAEYFEFWIKNRTQSDRMRKLQAVSPATYQYFWGLEAANWIL